MKERLKDYIDTIFADAPSCTKTEELKEQMYRDICDKYDDLIKEGRTPANAYNMSVSGIGDITPLIEDIKEEYGENKSYQTACAVPKREDDDTPLAYGIMNAVAVALYILCWVPLVFISELRLFGNASDVIGITSLMLFVTVATVLMLLKKYTLPKNQRLKKVRKAKRDESEDKHEKEGKSPAERIVDGIIWGGTFALYFLVSFITGAWHISWIMFIIAAALDNVAGAVIDLVKGGRE